MALVERYHSQEAKAEDPSILHDENTVYTVHQNAPVHPRKAVSLVQSEERAKHVGILAMEVYFPNVYVRSNRALPKRPPLKHIDACVTEVGPSQTSQTPYYGVRSRRCYLNKCATIFK
jgi:hypothetical protein